MNLNNTQELQKNKTYALTATALMTAVTCIFAPLSGSNRSGANITYQFCNFPVSLFVELEKRNFKPSDLSVTRTCRSSCILRFFRWNR